MIDRYNPPIWYQLWISYGWILALVIIGAGLFLIATA